MFNGGMLLAKGEASGYADAVYVCDSGEVAHF